MRTVWGSLEELFYYTHRYTLQKEGKGTNKEESLGASNGDGWRRFVCKRAHI